MRKMSSLNGETSDAETPENRLSLTIRKIVQDSFLDFTDADIATV